MLCITRQGRCAGPTLKGHFLRWLDRVEVVYEPDRLIATYIGRLGYTSHCFIRLDMILNAGQIPHPALWKGNTVFQSLTSFLLLQKTFCQRCSLRSRKSFLNQALTRLFGTCPPFQHPLVSEAGKPYTCEPASCGILRTVPRNATISCSPIIESIAIWNVG